MSRRKSSVSVVFQISLIVIAALMVIAFAVIWIVKFDSLSPRAGSSDTGAVESADVADTSGQPESSGSASSDTTSAVSSAASKPAGSSTVSRPSSSAAATSQGGSAVTVSHPADGSAPAWFQPEHNPTADTASDDGIKRCYLTFDDGPSKNVTPKILDILDQYNIKATFFVVGTAYLPNAKVAYDKGHAIGLHSNTHDWDIYKSDEAYYKDLAAISAKVKEYVGIDSNIIRFPGGSSNTVSRKRSKGIMSRLTKSVQENGYYYFDWNADTDDATGTTVSVEKIKKGVKRDISSSQKNVCLLMHDLDVKTTTVEALPWIIEYIRDMGFEFCTLNQYAYPFHHGVNN